MFLRAIWVVGVLLASCSSALAWGSEGHGDVGDIADHLLNAHAKAALQTTVGYTLAESGPWLDCVKSVQKQPDGSFKLDKGSYFTGQCPKYADSDAGSDSRMEDYVRRNWDTCRSDPRVDIDINSGCHNVYHYADVSTQHDRYSRAYVGTSDYDIVAAINAAIHFLECKEKSNNPALTCADVKTNISIKDEKEAVLMLAHLVGDIHQPLHIGAVYLDPSLKQVDPDAGRFGKEAGTQGGNLLEHVANNGQHKSLHSEWDGAPKGMSISPGDYTDAKNYLDSEVANNKDSMDRWATIWATDTLVLSRSAFKDIVVSTQLPITYKSEPPVLKWPVAFQDEPAYQETESDMVRKQLRHAGARLAMILNTIWP